MTTVAVRDSCVELFHSTGASFIAVMTEPDDLDALVYADQDLASQIQAISNGGQDSFPSAEDAATAWGIGFVMVVGCYVIARSVGAVVNFIK